MMGENNTITRKIERRTYIQGKLTGKFIGYIDPQKSDFAHENFYNLEISEATVIAHSKNISTWDIGIDPGFSTAEEFITRIPDEISLHIEDQDGVFSYYKVSLQGILYREISLHNQVYSDKRVFGEIEAEICGYIIHYDDEVINVETIDNIVTNFASSSEFYGSTPVKTKEKTGKREVDGTYARFEYYLSNRETYWGDWIRTKRAPWYSFGGILGTVFQILIFLVILLPYISLLLVTWKFIIIPVIILIGIWLLSFTFRILVKLAQVFSKMAVVLFAGIIVFGLLNSIPRVRAPEPDPIVLDTPEPVPSPRNDFSDTISNIVQWYDYDRNLYKSEIQVRADDVIQSFNNKNKLVIEPYGINAYNYLVSSLFKYDSPKLDLLYNKLGELKISHNLDNTHFAEVVTSLIQYLNYNLVLQGPCEARLYNDAFIREYLNDGGGCIGNVKYGVLSPTEFLAKLKGDCDTKTLLLFTILNHFNYDVVMLGSDTYRHSVIGISGPYNGAYKRFNGKKYYIWETTQPNQRPGMISREWANMNYWDINLISNKQHL